jgi:uncharacterized repeat protein (TIGR03803 family)
MKKILFSTIFLLHFVIASAQFTNLFDFAGTSNGESPYGSLISDGTYLYGMTIGGGINNLGTIFKIMPDGTGFNKLFDFDTTSGSQPFGELLFDGTFLYGMTNNHGANGYGTIFKIMPDGTAFDKLLDFDGISNGSSPEGSLISDGTFLYGMTHTGGISDEGTIFKIMPDGTGYIKLLDFNYLNGSSPTGSLFFDGTFLYGTTVYGGTSYYGTIFKIMPNGAGFTTLFDFASTTNIHSPTSTLISDGTFLYGTTFLGGTYNNGTIFKIMPNGTGFTKLIDFDGTTIGRTPYASLIFDGTFLYGVTYLGGPSLFGVLYKIMPNGTGYTILYDFTIPTGYFAYGSLLHFGTSIYGMTRQGGANNLGTIFKFSGLPAASINNGSISPEILIYPNPNNGLFNFSINDLQHQNIVVKITNVLGETVFEGVFKSDIENQINLNDKAKGIYSVQLTLADKNYFRKIVVQ